MIQISALFLSALIQVESGGNDLAIGDQGRSWGCLQISDAVIADVRQITGRWVSHSDAFDRTKAIRICRDYLNHYATFERLGYEPRVEDLARIWVGGPNGYKRAATLPHWRKVKAEIERQRALGAIGCARSWASAAARFTASCSTFTKR